MTNTYAKRHRQTIDVTELERMAFALGGSALLAMGLKRGKWDGLLIAGLGGILLYEGATGRGEIYRALGIRAKKGSGRSMTIPYEQGIRVDKSITINRPPDEVYRFWRNLENLPKFMKRLQSVEEIDNKHSHWVARAPAGMLVQWKAEIINEKENQLIGWRSLPGSDVPNAGSVHFEPANGGGTLVMVELQYDPPGGLIGRLATWLLGDDPEKQITEDLGRLKRLLESGKTPAPSAQKKPSSKGWNRDVVGMASEESFPASDPPSWTPESL